MANPILPTTTPQVPVQPPPAPKTQKTVQTQPAVKVETAPPTGLTTGTKLDKLV